jgi:hypothetical protein
MVGRPHPYVLSTVAAQRSAIFHQTHGSKKQEM